MTGSDPSRGTIGVVGGMGPAATCHFFELILDRTPADEDQDHLRVVVDSNPSIPDRTSHLLGDGPDPGPALVDAARTVEAAGADVLTVPCNTAHAFHDEIAAAVDVPVPDMIALTVDDVRSTPGIDRVGLLATDGTIAIGLYGDRLDSGQVELVAPDGGTQERVMEALYGVKAGRVEESRDLLAGAVRSLGDVDAVVAGCTEVPVALRPGDVDVPVVDPMTVLADRAIDLARPGVAPGQ